MRATLARSLQILIGWVVACCSTQHIRTNLEHPSLPEFLPLAQTYCKTRGRHQNTVNLCTLFPASSVFPKAGLVGPPVAEFSKGASRIRSAKRAQISAKRAQISANECKFKKRNNARRPLDGRRDLVERFSGCERFLRGRAEIDNSSASFLVPKKRARWEHKQTRAHTHVHTHTHNNNRPNLHTNRLTPPSIFDDRASQCLPNIQPPCI